MFHRTCQDLAACGSWHDYHCQVFLTSVIAHPYYWQGMGVFDIKAGKCVAPVPDGNWNVSGSGGVVQT